MIRLHPYTCLVIAAGAVCESFLLSPKGNTLLAFALLAILLTRTSGRNLLWRFSVHIFGVLFFIFLLNSLIYPESSARIGSLAILQKEGVLFAYKISARLLVLLFSQILLFTSAEPHRLIELMMQRGIGQSVGYVFLYAISLLELLRRKLTAVVAAQQSRGLRIGGGVFSRAQALLPILSPVVFSYLKESIHRSMALTLRGVGLRTSYTTLFDEQQPLHERIISIVVLVAVCSSLVLSLLKWAI